MDAEQFRQLLVAARDFGVSKFKAGDVEVEFSITPNYTITEPNLAPAINEIDPDEQMLAHIEELKAKAQMGVNQI